MQRLWTDAVKALVRDVTQEVDVGLQAALLSIKQETRQVVYSTGSTYERQRDEEGVARPEEKIKKRDNNTMMLEHKRRRGGSVNSSSDGMQDNKGSSLEEEDLVDRVMHALDNPSLPSSPFLPLSFFDPYHTTAPKSPTNYQKDLLSLSMNNHPERHEDNPMDPLLLSSTTYSKAQTSSDSLLNPPSQVIQQDLISFDSIPIEPFKEAKSSLLPKESVPINDCPIPVSFPWIQQTFEIPNDPPMNTPARRIPIEQGIAQGYVSPQQKAAQLGFNPDGMSSRPTGPIRFSSPTRPTSPHEIRLQAVVPNNPTNTPARRIPIEHGIAQGYVSPQQKVAQLGFKPDGMSSRPTGPIRFSSPTRPTSPHEIRLQAVVPNNPMNTPARRIPMEQAIAQGYVSPQKAAQLGFKPDRTPLTFVRTTPAGRVLISEHSANPVTRPGGTRFESPRKGKERELLVKPSSQSLVSRRNERKNPSVSLIDCLV